MSRGAAAAMASRTALILLVGSLALLALMSEAAATKKNTLRGQFIGRRAADIPGWEVWPSPAPGDAAQTATAEHWIEQYKSRLQFTNYEKNYMEWQAHWNNWEQQEYGPTAQPTVAPDSYHDPMHPEDDEDQQENDEDA